ncbi:MAG TPA: hypothetical protein VFC78_13680 [Tepidisphaeraceae bacterium]|nr:hypothetical protein [Tepidisphaeraceae bacterium]
MVNRTFLAALLIILLGTAAFAQEGQTCCQAAYNCPESANCKPSYDPKTGVLNGFITLVPVQTFACWGNPNPGVTSKCDMRGPDEVCNYESVFLPNDLKCATPTTFGKLNPSCEMLEGEWGCQ